MAVEFGDHSSGFRHIEVIRFINNEVLMNGGGPEFYMTFRSRSWNEIEDQLHTILVDPKVPRSLKRACTWSALALSVRVAARQREQQTRRVGRLQDQVGERETASWTLASELQRLREERDQAAAQLVSTQTALQEAMDEREVLRGRLLQAERSALADVPEPRMRQCRAAVWSLEEEIGSREAQSIANLAGQMPISPILSYLPGLPGPWVQAVHPFLRMPVPHPLPLSSQLPLGLPYSTPVPCPVVMESGATTAAMTAVIPQMAPAAICPPGLWVTLGSQETMTSAWDQVCHRQNECSEFLQHVSHLGDSVSHSEEEGPQKPQGTPPHGDSSNNHKESHVIPQVMAATEKKDPGKDQVTAALEVDSNHSIKEESVMPQGMSSQENNPSCTQKKYPGIPRKVVGPRDSINHNTKEDSVSPQETAIQVNKTSPILKKYPGILLRRPGLESSLSYKQKEDPKISHETAALGEDNRNCKQEDMITFQQIIPQATGGSPSERKDQVMPQVAGKSQNQKEEPNRFQASPLGKSKSYCVNKCPPKHLPPKQKSKPPQEAKAFESKPPQWIKAFESKPPQGVKAFESKPPQGVKAFESKPPQGLKAFESKPPQGVKAFEFKPPQGVMAFESKSPQELKTFESKPPQGIKALESKSSQGVKAFEFKPPQGLKAFESKSPQGVKAFESKSPQGVKAFESKSPQGVKAFESKLPQGVKAFESKPPQRVKAFESKPPQGAFESKPPQRAKFSEAKQEKAFSHRSQMNWVCPSCKAVNRSWSRGCYKCAKAGAQFQRKYFDPKPTY